MAAANGHADIAGILADAAAVRAQDAQQKRGGWKQRDALLEAGRLVPGGHGMQTHSLATRFQRAVFNALLPPLSLTWPPRPSKTACVHSTPPRARKPTTAGPGREEPRGQHAAALGLPQRPHRRECCRRRGGQSWWGCCEQLGPTKPPVFPSAARACENATILPCHATSIPPHLIISLLSGRAAAARARRLRDGPQQVSARERACVQGEGREAVLCACFLGPNVPASGAPLATHAHGVAKHLH